MTTITNETRTVRDIYIQFLAGRSTEDIASDLTTPRLHVGYIRSATGNRAALDRQPVHLGLNLCQPSVAVAATDDVPKPEFSASSDAGAGVRSACLP